MPCEGDIDCVSFNAGSSAIPHCIPAATRCESDMFFCHMQAASGINHLGDHHEGPLVPVTAVTFEAPRVGAPHGSALQCHLLFGVTQRVSTICQEGALLSTANVPC